MNQDLRLQAKVDAHNAVNKAAIEIYSWFRAACVPFLNTKIVNADGRLSKKFRDALPQLPNGRDLRGYVSADGGYSLKVVLQASVCADGIAQYAERYVYIGDLHNHELSRFYDAPTGLRTDWTAAEVRQTRLDFNKKKAELDSLQTKINDFGMHD